MTHPANVVELTAEGMVAGGYAKAREPGGRVVLVLGALPSETVRVAIDEEHPRHALGHVVEVLEPSRHRQVPACSQVARGCGACQWQHVAIDEQVVLKQDILADAFRHIAKMPTPPIDVEALDPWGFRTTVRAGVVGDRAGYRAARSHATVAVDECLVAHPLLAELLLDGRYPGCSEVTIRCGSRTGERLVAPSPGTAHPEVPPDVRRDHIHEDAAGMRWRISASSFFQSRPDGVDALARSVVGALGDIEPGSAAIDLYSGVGVFAGVMATNGLSVTAVEMSATAVADARSNLDGLDVEVVKSDVDRWAPTAARVVVADPSRAGLGKNGVPTVHRSGAERLILVSCDAASLARDAVLLARTGFAPTRMTLVDLFPHTSHVEVVTVFDR